MTSRTVSRRGFLSGTGAAALGGVALGSLEAQERSSLAGADQPADFIPVQFELNNEPMLVRVEPRVTLLDLLREHLGVTGTKVGCNHGQCGACTVHVDGRRVNACLLLVGQLEGSAVTTIEGLAKGDELHPMQQAFIDQDAFQCGYCTPGQIMSAVACVQEGHAASEETIREYMSGNLCRCAAYPKIVAAIQQAKTQMGG